MTTSHLILMIAVAGAVTFGTRLFPFALFGQSKEVPKFIKYLGNVLPVAILGILIVYCLKDFEKGDVNYIVPQLICVALTAIDKSVFFFQICTPAVSATQISC